MAIREFSAFLGDNLELDDAKAVAVQRELKFGAT
jgi:hypothetical protein